MGGIARIIKRRASLLLGPGWIAAALALVLGLGVGPAASGVAPPVEVRGPLKLLVIAVRFPGVKPAMDLQKLEQKVYKVKHYVEDSSYGKASLQTRLVGWYDMPAPLSEYKVSPYNYFVDRDRVRRLVADAVTAARRDVDLSSFDYFWIVVGARTMPGEGYGMIAYAANPGMLTGVRRGRVKLEAVPLPGGGSFSEPTIVSAENAHPGHAAHDLLHALGGVREGFRAVPDLYDFDLQSDPPKGVKMTSELFAVHTGPWDIMSQHFIEVWKSPPPPSSFTRLQLGWISADQVAEVRPGETRELILDPLARGRGLLVARVPLDAHRYLLVENRQPVGGDEVLPSSGMLVLEVDTSLEEGSGIVKAADANPGVPRLKAAPFVPGGGQRRYYENSAKGVAIAPLALEDGGRLKLVVTTPERVGGFLAEARPR